MVTEEKGKKERDPNWHLIGEYTLNAEDAVTMNRLREARTTGDIALVVADMLILPERIYGVEIQREGQGDDLVFSDFIAGDKVKIYGAATDAAPLTLERKKNAGRRRNK